MAISGLIDVNPNNIGVVGSAKFGYSLAPQKNYSEFSDASDLDVVIVSTQLFESTYGQLREAFDNGYRQVSKRHSSDFFQGFVSIKDSDNPEYTSSYLRSTVLMLKDMKSKVADSYKIASTLNFRIYNTWRDAESYHAFGMSQLKGQLR